MKQMKKLTPFLLFAMLSGCVTLPAGPSANVLPAQGKSFEKFRTEDAICRQWAEQQLGTPAQETQDRNVATGAIAGTAIGAGVGAALGSASGHAGAGAAIGAVSGLLFGTAAGAGAGDAYGYEAQRRYDNTYVQCMYSYGNQIPGYRKATVTPPPVAVAPPPPPEPVAVAPPPPAPRVVAVSPPPRVVYEEPEFYPPPPEVYVEESPPFIYSPGLNMYVAVGVPYDLVYTGNEYFYYNGGRWYRGPYYNGPWDYAPRRSYPPAFARYRINNIRSFRDREYRRYQRDGGHYDGRVHRPEFRGERRSMGRRDERR